MNDQIIKQLTVTFPLMTITEVTPSLITATNGCWVVAILLDGDTAFIKVSTKTSVSRAVAATDVPIVKIGAVAHHLVTTATVSYL